MPKKITVYPIYGVAGFGDDEIFDSSVLPFHIVPDVTVEDVSPMFNEQTFSWVKKEMGRRDVEILEAVHYAIVHRYGTDDFFTRSDAEVKSEQHVRYLAACLRLIRPMRQNASLMQGELRPDGTLDVRHFEHPLDFLGVPDVQQLFHLRNSDLPIFRDVAKEFLRATSGEFWKFRMPLEFHDRGHFEDSFWKSRYLLWCSALEGMFTSNKREHKGSLVAKERIKWFLGPDTCIYEPHDIPDCFTQCTVTVSDIVDDIYKVRNIIAHGDRLPDEYFQQSTEYAMERGLRALQVLEEGLSFIVRKSLLRILQHNLLEHFVSSSTAEVYFANAGLTRSEIQQRTKQHADKDED
jgi:hypothetical protein